MSESPFSSPDAPPRPPVPSAVASGLPLNSWPAPHPVIDAPYGPRYEPPPPPPTPGWVQGPLPPAPRSRRWIGTFVVICLLVAGLGGALVAAFLANEEDGPNTWDPRVADLAGFVEAATGQTFANPVRVRFLDDADFEQLVTRSGAQLSDKEKQAIADEEAVGRAFGWYSGETRLFDENNQLSGAGILAYYSYDTRQIVARTRDPKAATLDVGLRVTIVHEMTHVIQDQRLGGIETIRAGATGDQGDEAVGSLIEGHAVFIELKYLASLTPAERDEFYSSSAAQGSEIDDRVADVPNVLSVPLTAPYVYGPILVDAADRSPSGIPGLYSKLPVAMDQLLDPRAYFSGDVPETLVAPTGSDPLTAIKSGTVGALRLYLTLAVALPSAEAWDAALLWGNDHYTANRSPDGTVCVEWSVQGDTVDKTARLYEALSRWATSRVALASVRVTPGPSITVSECDPGPSVTQTLVSDEAAAAVFIRANVLAGLLTRTGDLAVASCATDVLFQEFPAADLNAEDDDVKARTDQLVATCT